MDRAVVELVAHANIGAPVPEHYSCSTLIPVMAAISALGPLPETLTVWSGRNDGGRHLYFTPPVRIGDRPASP